MGKSTINGHFPWQNVSSPEGISSFLHPAIGAPLRTAPVPPGCGLWPAICAGSHAALTDAQLTEAAEVAGASDWRCEELDVYRKCVYSSACALIKYIVY